MINVHRLTLCALAGASLLGPLALAGRAAAATKGDIDMQSDAALRNLYAVSPGARALAKRAKAVLIFPTVVKAGFVFGAAYGEGELEQGGHVDGYYNSFSGSWGLQAGAQSYGYAVFLMDDKALRYVHRSQGWEVGVGPTIVVLDEGAAATLSSSTANKDAYAFVFDQKGLMAGVSIEGTKMSRIKTETAQAKLSGPEAGPTNR